MPDPLESLQHRIDEAKSHEPDVAPANSVSKPTGKGAAYATEFFAGIFVGGAIGYGADRFFDTTPVLFIIMLFLGAGAGVRNMMREVGRDTKENETGKDNQ